MVLDYHGLDGVRRRTRIVLEPSPDVLEGTRAAYRLRLDPDGELAVRVTVACETGPGRAPAMAFADAADATRAQLARNAQRGCTLLTSNEEFNEWIARSVADLAMMTTAMPSGLYPYAGVPWFCCPFGRDGLVTAFETLWMDPALARGVLCFLADTQATEIDPVRDAEPGKILHEARAGEMAALGEIPFGRYYGSADATPLFVMLASAYLRRTGDTATVAQLWPNLQRALAWIDRYGDADGDGFIEYARPDAERSPSPGLEGLRGLGLARRRQARRRADRAVRDPGLCVRGTARRSVAGRGPRVVRRRAFAA